MTGSAQVRAEVRIQVKAQYAALHGQRVATLVVVFVEMASYDSHEVIGGRSYHLAPSVRE